MKYTKNINDRREGKKMTNNEYYDYIIDLRSNEKFQSMSLKQFLINFLKGLEAYQNGLTRENYLNLIEKSLDQNVSIDIEDLSKCKAYKSGKSKGSYEGLCNILGYQIYDLDGIEKSGVLDPNKKYYGDVISPRGNNWNNYRLEAYLECSAAWLLDACGEAFEFTTDWDDLMQLAEMGRLYE
jgi:hypothetical protein